LDEKELENEGKHGFPKSAEMPWLLTNSIVFPRGIWLSDWMVGWWLKTRNQLLALCWLLCGGLSRRLLAVSIEMIIVTLLRSSLFLNVECHGEYCQWCSNMSLNCVLHAGLAPHISSLMFSETLWSLFMHLKNT
jgi:hypothetical protein